jgi:hypothetical protein
MTQDIVARLGNPTEMVFEVLLFDGPFRDTGQWITRSRHERNLPHLDV